MEKYVPVKISYKTFESSEGSNEILSPVIFLHGMMCSKAYWHDIPQIIADRTKRRVYTYDARNHGESEYTKEFTFDIGVDDLFHFMDTINIPKAILVGHSMGGYCATRAALKKPERVEMVFSEDMGIKIPAEFLRCRISHMKSRTDLIRSIPAGYSVKDALKFIANAMEKYLPDSPLLQIEKERILSSSWILNRKPDGRFDINNNSEVLIESIENCANLMTDPCGQYNDLAIFIYGGNSPFEVVKEEDDIKKYFPNAELVEFPGADHYVHLDFPNKFVYTLLHYLLK